MTVDEGQLYSFGCNYYGQLGVDMESDEVLRPLLVNAFSGELVQQVSCGSSHVVVLMSSGSVFAWGCGEFGDDLIHFFSSWIIILWSTRSAGQQDAIFIRLIFVSYRSPWSRFWRWLSNTSTGELCVESNSIMADSIDRWSKNKSRLTVTVVSSRHWFVSAIIVRGQIWLRLFLRKGLLTIIILSAYAVNPQHK